MSLRTERQKETLRGFLPEPTSTIYIVKRGPSKASYFAIDDGELRDITGLVCSVLGVKYDAVHFVVKHRFGATERISRLRMALYPDDDGEWFNEEVI